MAASRPSTARASVRATIRVSEDTRESTAALILEIISPAEVTDLSRRWPQRLGVVWSSSWSDFFTTSPIACSTAIVLGPLDDAK